MKIIKSPKPFLALIDKEGDIVDFYKQGLKEYNSEELKEFIKYMNENFPANAPHSVWSCDGSFNLVDLS